MILFYQLSVIVSRVVIGVYVRKPDIFPLQIVGGTAAMKNTEVKFVYSGLFITDDEWIHPTRREETWEIICVADGVVNIREEDCSEVLKKGDVILLEPHKEHTGTIPSTGRTSFFWLHFTTDKFEKLGIRKRVIRGFSDRSLFRKLLHVSNTKGYPDYAADAILLSLLAELAHTCAEEEKEGGAAVRIAHEAAEWIRINTDKKLTVTTVADHFRYNGEYLSKVFRKVHGMPLKQYIYEARIRAACDILCNTAQSVGEVAIQFGFNNENQFVHFFKYHCGQSPTAFRNSSFNIHMNKA